jgi:hypothetical protein
MLHVDHRSPSGARPLDQAADGGKQLFRLVGLSVNQGVLDIDDKQGSGVHWAFLLQLVILTFRSKV